MSYPYRCTKGADSHGEAGGHTSGLGRIWLEDLMGNLHWDAPWASAF